MSSSSVMDKSTEVSLDLDTWVPTHESSRESVHCDFQVGSGNTQKSMSTSVPFALLDGGGSIGNTAMAMLELDYCDFGNPEDLEFTNLMKENDDMMCRIELLDQSTQEHISKANWVLKSTEPSFFAKIFPKFGTSATKTLTGANPGLQQIYSGDVIAEASSAFVAGQLQPTNRRKKLFKRLTSWLKGTHMISDGTTRSYKYNKYDSTRRQGWRYSEPGLMTEYSREDTSYSNGDSSSSPFEDNHMKLVTPILMNPRRYHNRSYSVGTVQSRHIYEKLRSGFLLYQSGKKKKPVKDSKLDYKCSVDALENSKSDTEKHSVATNYLETLGNPITI